MALQLVRGTAATVTCGTGGLLPRLFTLAPRKKKQNLEAVILCYLSCILADAFPLGSTMPCVARTFLFPLRDSDRTACYLSKNVRFAAVFRKSFVIFGQSSSEATPCPISTLVRLKPFLPPAMLPATIARSGAMSASNTTSARSIPMPASPLPKLVKSKPNSPKHPKNPSDAKSSRTNIPS